MTDEQEQGSVDTGGRPDEEAETHPALPYVVMLALAVFLGILLGSYVWLRRAEIVQILTQSPT